MSPRQTGANVARGGRQQLDVRGLLCPLPVIRTQERVESLSTGTLLDILATDPGVLQDIPAWCRVHGHGLVATARDDTCIRITIEVCET
ncbi:MAG: sulfurtransferase TusA family protein [Gammaproteobacteria bacterium]|nr:sulfurtransferase TusA family protein [Gammaproteobacteria bacterium]MDE0054684.1 sulfurtransferase TusA family protein [Gammaproteobacteria bacterium]MDE0224665.1 sulfurtransferase TusA family protein [Gammaproteobacteria bacterium]MDE0451632.1 sulfurtransferase TusA family protein [Gammaproteobacteria bacterium]